MPALPRNCKRNEIHFNATNSLKRGVGKVWKVGVAASQETCLTDQITILTEGKGEIRK